MGEYFESKRGTLGENLRKLRKENGYTQQYLADYIGVERSAYSKYESSRIPDLNSVIQLAALYGVSVDTLIGDYFDETVNSKKLAAFAKASSPDGKDGSKLTRDELKLLALFRNSIRKKDILEYVRRISSEDSEL